MPDPADRLATPVPEVAAPTDPEPPPTPIAPRVRPSEPSPVVRRGWSAEDFRAWRQERLASAPSRRLSLRAQGRAPRLSERDVAADRVTLAHRWTGSRTIGFLDVVGASALGPVLEAAAAFASARPGGVVAWDGSAQLPPDRPLSLVVLGDHVRPDASGRFDILATDVSAGRSAPRSTLRMLTGFYPVVVADIGLERDGSVSTATLEAIDLLVLVVPATEEAGYDALARLDAMGDDSGADRRDGIVTTLIDPAGAPDGDLVADLSEALTRRTRAVYRIPSDPLSPQARRSWLRACAGMTALL
jgi:hypothetical protein